MIKISTIFVLGILTAILPFSGFKTEHKTFLYIVFGLLVAILSVIIRKELHEVLRLVHKDEPKADTFVESSPEDKA